MYSAALEFLEDEREAFRPYEQLGSLTDEELERPTDLEGPARGWSGRDLVAHVVGWLEHALDVARELALGGHSETFERMDRTWDEGLGDQVNADMLERWRAMPLSEVRHRLATSPGELRGTLTVVPEARWIKDARLGAFFVGDLIEHDEEHLPELAAILASAGRA